MKKFIIITVVIMLLVGFGTLPLIYKMAQPELSYKQDAVYPVWCMGDYNVDFTIALKMGETYREVTTTRLVPKHSLYYIDMALMLPKELRDSYSNGEITILGVEGTVQLSEIYQEGIYASLLVGSICICVGVLIRLKKW